MSRTPLIHGAALHSRCPRKAGSDAANATVWLAPAARSRAAASATPARTAAFRSPATLFRNRAPANVTRTGVRSGVTPRRQAGAPPAEASGRYPLPPSAKGRGYPTTRSRPPGAIRVATVT